ncbi:putative dehydrogenase [Paenibacillus taihuensis]|uniref:Putative dehydrogenase n=1 Tax=Paenibacillus taihuensis TaxID=1156355 RepID=A0A3D9SE74_9BACL|nr:Gfo/Idh/MocA family oxidoreductase [Paenibacillus taihuensis]REE93152.1 putative dehydrogenase [Paenibacillus taihuensis]
MRVGVIGAGAMGENHVRVYASIPGYCTLSGIYDADMKRAQSIAGKYQTTAYGSLYELLDVVDAVSIAVPTPVHYEIGLACLAKGVHMLMEKPLASSLAEGRELIRRSSEAGIKLQVGHIELYNSTIKALCKILEGEEVIALDIHRMSPYELRWKHVNVVEDLMIHDIYILHYLLRSRTSAVQAMGYLEQNTIRHAAALLRMENGLMAQVTASYITEEKVRMVRIVTRSAFIQADLLDKKIIVTRSTHFSQPIANSNYMQQNMIEKFVLPIQEPLRMQLIDFLDSIASNTVPRVTGEDGLLAMEVTGQITDVILRTKGN